MERKVNVPEDVEVEVSDRGLKVSGNGNEVFKKLQHPLIEVELENSNVVVRTKKDNKKIESICRTFASKIDSAVKGVTEGFEYRLRVVYRHFPVEVNVQGDRLVVSNFLGERENREADILEGVQVKVDDEDIVVSGADKELVGQTAANIERKMQAPSSKDRRVFEDGIYIVKKPGKEG